MPTLESNTRLLVIDDNRAIHEDFVKILVQSHRDPYGLDAAEQALFGPRDRDDFTPQFEVDSAFQGQEGLEKIRAAAAANRPYALAFIDIRMPPGWDGIETVCRIWQEFPDFQVVICTAHSDYSWGDICHRLKHRERLLILKKPFDSLEVTQLAYALTEKWRLAQEAALNLATLEQAVATRTRELQTAIQELHEQIAHRERAELHLRQIAFHDSLTGLPNRENLQTSIQTSINQARLNEDRAFAVMFVDVDRFKSINDGLGHELGDQLLKAFSERIQQTLRSDDLINSLNSDSLTGRLGGDEFVIVLKRLTNVTDSVQVAQRLLDVLDRPYEIHGQTICVTPSIGIVGFASHYVSASEMLRDADTAMYEAKAQGGNEFVVFDQSMQSAIQMRLSIENDLRTAIQAQQFWLAFQPIWHSVQRGLLGIEALIRWNHPQQGLVRPGVFIPIAEQTNLILPIGKWVLQEACRQFQAWKSAGLLTAQQYISVNLSRAQLIQPNLIPIVREVLEESGLSGHELQIEITESLMMENPRQAGDALAQLKRLGVRLAIDDFGTGHSSLACLYDFQVDTLKIDRSFIARLNEARTNAALVNSIIRLAENLGLDCVAEGVELPGQLLQLAEMGCQGIQGYLLGQPTDSRTFVQNFLAPSVPAEDPPNPASTDGQKLPTFGNLDPQASTSVYDEIFSS